MSGNMHRLAVAFRASLARTCPQVQLKVDAFGFDGFGLVIRVEVLEPTRFNRDFLEYGPAVGRPMLSAEGERLWEWLWATGRKVIAGEDRPGDLVALVLAPDAAADARAQLGFSDPMLEAA